MPWSLLGLLDKGKEPFDEIPRTPLFYGGSRPLCRPSDARTILQTQLNCLRVAESFTNIFLGIIMSVPFIMMDQGGWNECFAQTNGMTAKSVVLARVGRNFDPLTSFGSFTSYSWLLCVTVNDRLPVLASIPLMMFGWISCHLIARYYRYRWFLLLG